MKKTFLLLAFALLSISAISQDVIYTNSGEEIQSKVIEITNDAIKYKKFDQLDGPIRNISKMEVFMIIYQDGTRELFKKQEAQKPIEQIITKEEPKPKPAEPLKQVAEDKFGSFIDLRDGKEYKTVKIGNQTWMAENLNYESNQSWCYDNNPEYCKQYGRLYTYEAANNVCPDGWHLPSDEEWKELEVELGMKTKVDEEGWRGNSPGQGFKLKKGGGSGFDAELGGNRYWGAYSKLNNSGIFWTSSEKLENTKNAYAREIEERASIKRFSESKDYGYSVRCIRKETNNQNKTITINPKIDNYLAKGGNKYFSCGIGYGASYGGIGFKLQGKIGNRNLGLGFSTSIGSGLLPHCALVSIGLKTYFKSLYFSFILPMDVEDIELDIIPYVIGYEFELNKHFNFDMGAGLIVPTISAPDDWQVQATFNLGINYKF
jgi:uncharacterized protein (TIGR02145 family)